MSTFRFKYYFILPQRWRRLCSSKMYIYNQKPAKYNNPQDYHLNWFHANTWHAQSLLQAWIVRLVSDYKAQLNSTSNFTHQTISISLYIFWSILSQNRTYRRLHTNLRFTFVALSQCYFTEAWSENSVVRVQQKFHNFLYTQDQQKILSGILFSSIKR